MGYTVIGALRTRAFRVLWMLEELGEPFEHIAAAPRTDEVRRHSPLGKVPVLLDGEAAIPDGTAILTYLADKHGAWTAPAGTLARARQDAWTFRILDEVDALLWTAARHSFILPEDERVPAIKDSVKAEYARNIARICDEMPGPYLMGEAPSVPDILLCHCGGWAQNARFPEPPEAFAAYLTRLRARPAFQRAAAL
ncbi:glutathione S-transferase family protein [Aestuariicoccus sp. MJ-SS9]|uniref:glutathione S-transferase family protein n=1 Tax=Aestuariicoccus sp. MJ-SS9 TaxID=3079855 RepID=UPI0029095BEA|nr:glutathione S-transferase family protein [Aestuariicoccus sp. MJ-SS9]MDU8912916.1 glutathione S-transferase family protein [Aestuariicoccus sp. MJ-SS9]